MDYPPIDHVLENETPIRIRTTEFALSDHSVRYIMGEVVHDIYAPDGITVLISQGEEVIIDAVFKKEGALGNPGMITITGATTRAVDGKLIMLNVAPYTETGKSRGCVAWGVSILGFMCCFWSLFILGFLSLFCGILCLLFLLIKGKQAEIPYGTYFDCSIKGNYKILSGVGAQCKM